MILDEIDRVRQSHHFFHVSFVAAKARQQHKSLVPIVDIVENPATNQAQQVSIPFVVKLNEFLRHPQSPHGLVVNALIGPRCKRKCKRRSYTAITFLDVAVIKYQSRPITVWRSGQAGNRAGLEQVNCFAIDSPLDILRAAHFRRKTANLC